MKIYIILSLHNSEASYTLTQKGMSQNTPHWWKYCEVLIDITKRPHLIMHSLTHYTLHVTGTSTVEQLTSLNDICPSLSSSTSLIMPLSPMWVCGSPNFSIISLSSIRSMKLLESVSYLCKQTGGSECTLCKCLYCCNMTLTPTKCSFSSAHHIRTRLLTGILH